MNGHMDPQRLRQIELFQHLTEEQVVGLANLMHPRRFRTGAGIITAEQPGEVVYVIESGSVKVELDQADGSQAILAILGLGDTVGEMSLVDRGPRSANVIALEPSVLLGIDRVHFERALSAMGELSKNLARLLNSRLRMANQQILALSTMDVAGRMGRQLLSFATRYGRPEGEEGGVRIPVRLTQSDLAGLVGASRERVNHVWGSFRQNGFVSVDPGYHILIRDQQALADFCTA